ncbi:MAG: DEAD/DEAH box helicase, partial [Candidatus Dadabacteria bacterium]
LLRECGTIRKVSFLGKRGEKLKFSPFKVDAVLECRWQSDGLHLEMKWVLGDERPIEYQTGIVGTNPYWCEIDNTIYELSNSAAKIASIFVHTSSITVPLEKCGPILEVLRRSEIESSSEIIVLNPEQMPKALVQDPKPVVEFVDISAIQEGKGERIELSATLSFQYTRKEGVVCLPNRAKEEEYEQRLKDLGFYYDPSKRVYVISGDDALDLIWDLRSTLGPQWKVQGLNLVRSTIRFAQLTLRLSISDTNTIEEDGFNCYVTLLQNGAMVPIGSLFKNAAPGAERWVKLDSGAYGRVPGGSLSELRAVLGSLSSTFWMANAIRVKVSSSQGISLRSLKGKPGIEVVASDAFEEALNKILSFRKIKRVPISKKFKGRLRQYQKEGFYWMHFLDELGFGGILADEMGLGKTVQALAHIQSLKDKGVGLPSLVVVPTSIITNWYYEARRFTPDLSVLVLHGPGRKKLFSKIDDYDLVLTTYALVRVDRSVFERHRFYLLVLDEAQNIKNEQASVSQSVKMIPSERRLALTGTPVENRPMDLWSIFDFLMPDYLGSKEYFRKNVEKVLITGGEAGNRVGEYLKRKVRPFILKRTKKEVEKDLPPKVESIVRVEMTPSQRVLYNEILGETRSKVFGEVKKRGIGGASMYILAALLRLRQICNHPRSVNGLQELGDLTSGKFEALKELVTEALESGKKILLYSQFLNMLSIIKDWLESQGVKYVYLDGSTKNRQDIVDAFNTDDSIRVFVISLKAGGFGLNLTAADTVMIYDPWWNPAVEQQASDRAHRIGQTKIVNVYRFVTENSVESHIMDLQERKEKIVDALIDPAASSPLKLSREDLEVIFEVG